MSINFQVGIYFHHDLRVMWLNFWENRPKVKVTRAQCIQLKCAIT